MRDSDPTPGTTRKNRSRAGRSHMIIAKDQIQVYDRLLLTIVVDGGHCRCLGWRQRQYCNESKVVPTQALVGTRKSPPSIATPGVSSLPTTTTTKEKFTDRERKRQNQKICVLECQAARKKMGNDALCCVCFGVQCPSRAWSLVQ
jgi:hypothetical protein